MVHAVRYFVTRCGVSWHPIDHPSPVWRCGSFRKLFKALSSDMSSSIHSCPNVLLQGSSYRRYVVNVPRHSAKQDHSCTVDGFIVTARSRPSLNPIWRTSVRVPIGFIGFLDPDNGVSATNRTFLSALVFKLSAMIDRKWRPYWNSRWRPQGVGISWLHFFLDPMVGTRRNYLCANCHVFCKTEWFWWKPCLSRSTTAKKLVPLHLFKAGYYHASTPTQNYSSLAFWGFKILCT